ncbi:MAG: radical SAM protein [Omnitrophica WOR_2 bacterium RIFCSPHIGHO2_02_FULL_50_17]|nr:MAG: radical SAM protein [Omnitrophica WOR_2 bacterium RIFCSPHIGHO2_02_FULL_50_17]
METETYQKHHSFENFFSSLQSDIHFQKQRVVELVNRHLSASTVQPGQKEVLSAAIKDLIADEASKPNFKITTFIADELSRTNDGDVPRHIFHRYRYDVYPRQRKLESYPPYLQIEPSSICNYRCVFCYQGDKEFTDKSGDHMGYMTLDLFKRIVDEIIGNVEFISLASRGEPLACKEIDQMLEYCAGKFLGLKINTNASLLNEKHCHAILAGGVNTVVFSADAAAEPLYSQLRVRGNLGKVLKNIRMFNSIKQKHYPDSKIITRVSGVKFSAEQEMTSMADLWGELVDQVCFVVYNPSHGLDNIYQAPQNTVTTPCSELWRRMFIWYNGQVNPCETDYKSTLSVGNIGEKSIAEVWSSEKYNKLRMAHANKQRIGVYPCNRCVVT